MSKTTLEEGALDSIKLPRSDTPSSIDGTTIITDKPVTTVVATTVPVTLIKTKSIILILRQLKENNRNPGCKEKSEIYC